MIEVLALPGYVQAAILVSVVLVEAVVFYVGYGVLEENLAPTVIEHIQQA
ncbi:DUF7512 family protein [Natranaeroarchaeum sulfidigenes]|nr:hypothetical protein [Natranaeroarchaeum sulfidigenes]